MYLSKDILTHVMFANIVNQDGKHYNRISLIFDGDYGKRSHHIQFEVGTNRFEVIKLLRDLAGLIFDEKA